MKQTKTLADVTDCRDCGWPEGCPNRYCSAHREYRPPVRDRPRKPRTAYERLIAAARKSWKGRKTC
jgi:hypothetical protein